MARFTALNNKTRQYIDNTTGEIISRRQYQQRSRGGITNELNARLNAAKNPELAAIRPARGRASALKKTETEKHLIAQARLEDAARRKEIAAEKKAEREAEKLLAKRATKKVHKRRKITMSVLKPGHKGARLPFDNYDDYVAMFWEAKRGGKVIFYGLGASGYHENTGKELDITVFTMRTLTNPIPETLFNDEMDAAIEEISYFEFSHYWIHLAFKEEFAQQRATKKRAKRKSR